MKGKHLRRSSPAEPSKSGIARVSGTDLHRLEGGITSEWTKAGTLREPDGTGNGREAFWLSKETVLVQVCRPGRHGRIQACITCSQRVEQTFRKDVLGSVDEARSCLRLSPTCPNLTKVVRCPGCRPRASGMGWMCPVPSARQIRLSQQEPPRNVAGFQKVGHSCPLPRAWGRAAARDGVHDDIPQETPVRVPRSGIHLGIAACVSLSAGLSKKHDLQQGWGSTPV
jgi:hypothetical protein